MKQKLTTYQRLKQQNEILQNQLDILACEPDSRKAIEIKLKYNLKRSIEKQLMFGNHISKEPASNNT